MGVHWLKACMCKLWSSVVFREELVTLCLWTVPMAANQAGIKRHQLVLSESHVCSPELFLVCPHHFHEILLLKIFALMFATLHATCV